MISTAARPQFDRWNVAAFQRLERSLREVRRTEYAMPRASELSEFERSGLQLLSSSELAAHIFEFSRTESLPLAIWILQYAIDRVWGRPMLTGPDRTADGVLGPATIALAERLDPDELVRAFDEFVTLFRATSRKVAATRGTA